MIKIMFIFKRNSNRFSFLTKNFSVIKSNDKLTLSLGVINVKDKRNVSKSSSFYKTMNDIFTLLVTIQIVCIM